MDSTRCLALPNRRAERWLEVPGIELEEMDESEPVGRSAGVGKRRDGGAKNRLG